jgi:NAD(P)H-nitrite reductase large subunit
MKPEESKRMVMHSTQSSDAGGIEVNMCYNCRHKNQYPVGVARELKKRFSWHLLSSEFKVGVSGCHNTCAALSGNDLDLVGTMKGWKIVIGAREGGDLPQITQELAGDLTSEQALEMVGKVLDYYKRSGTNERLGKHLAEVGMENIRKVLNEQDVNIS